LFVNPIIVSCACLNTSVHTRKQNDQIDTRYRLKTIDINTDDATEKKKQRKRESEEEEKKKVIFFQAQLVSVCHFSCVEFTFCNVIMMSNSIINAEYNHDNYPKLAFLLTKTRRKIFIIYARFFPSSCLLLGFFYSVNIHPNL